MYTQCPECRASFRVTAAVLQQAAGRVRCGGCGHSFNALERLSETPPDRGGSRPGGGKHSLLEDFDALSATENVRIEDTGVEWQVLDEDEAADPDPQEPLELDAVPQPAEARYDDNTPLVLDDDEAAGPPEPPRRRAEDFLEPRSPEFDERQVDLALSEPEDWTDLLAEVGDPAAAEHDPREDAPPWDHGADIGPDDDADAEPTGEHPVPEWPDAGDELTLVADDEPALPADEAAAWSDDDPTVSAGGEAAPEAASVEHEEAESADDAAAASGDSGHYVPPPTEEEITINRLIDQDLLRLAQEQRDLAATSAGSKQPAEAPSHVETIIMEGAFVRSSLGPDEPAEEQAGPQAEDDTGELLDLRDTYVRARDSERDGRHVAGAARYAAVAGVVALALLLGAQVVHAYRETLATHGSFGQGLISVYAAAGVPITPEWDVNGWQFQDTQSSTDGTDRVLTISTTLANASEQALPYPLLHVALTDRYEEIIASQLLVAGQYLDIRAADGRVAPGGKLEATITIAPLSPQAAGFKLNVCYPLNAGEVRCASGAFRNR